MKERDDMYFPYLRGRQFELIALRELVEKDVLSSKIIPVIEPVKLSSTLLKTIEMYGKYDHNILLNDIQKLDKIQHKHSLVAIQFPDTSAEKKYLVYYDERWDCKLFLNYKTVDRADEESVINKVSADLNVDKSQINCRYISSKVQEKYSESHQENRIYNHRLYEIKIQVFPEDEQKENFVVNGRHYYWMSISDMERDPNIVKKNLDVIDFVKESMHA